MTVIFWCVAVKIACDMANAAFLFCAAPHPLLPSFAGCSPCMKYSTAFCSSSSQNASPFSSSGMVFPVNSVACSFSAFFRLLSVEMFPPPFAIVLSMYSLSVMSDPESFKADARKLGIRMFIDRFIVDRAEPSV